MTLTEHISTRHIPEGVGYLGLALVLMIVLGAALQYSAPDVSPDTEDWHGNVARSDSLR